MMQLLLSKNSGRVKESSFFPCPQPTGILGTDLSTASAGFCPANLIIAFCKQHNEGIQIAYC